MPTQFGTSIRPLGSTKLKIIEILEKIVRLSSRKINKAIIEHRLFRRIMVSIYLSGINL